MTTPQSSAHETISTPAPQAPDLVSNTSIAMGSKVVYLLSRLVIPPIVLSHLSLAEYGLWTSCFILIMYVGLTDAGFSNVYVRYTAQYHAQGNQQAINRLLSTGVLLLSGLASLVFLLVATGLPWLLEHLQIDTAMHHEATVLILAVVALFLLDMTLGAYCYLLHGLQRIREEQRIVMRGYLIELALIVVLLYAGCGVYALLIAFAVRYLSCLVSYRQVAKRVLPGLHLSVANFDRQYMALFFGFGAKVQLSALVATVLSTIDRILASLIGGTPAIALFDLGNKLPLSAMIIPSTLSNLSMARAAQLDAQQNTGEITTLLGDTTRAIALLSALPLAFIAVFASAITVTWLGARSDYALIPLLMLFSSLTQHMHIITGPASSIMRATGQIRFEFIYHVLRLSLIGLAVLLFHALIDNQLVALAYGLFAGGALASILYIALAYRQLGARQSHWFNRCILPALLPYAVALALLPLWHSLIDADQSRLLQLVVLGLFGIAYLGLAILALWALALRPNERTVLAARLPLRRALSRLIARIPFLRSQTS